MEEKRESMNKDQLYEKFVEMFPAYSEHVTEYKKIGSRTIAIYFKIVHDSGYTETNSIVFLYINDHNWNLGTKQWRKRPVPVTQKKEEDTDQND